MGAPDRHPRLWVPVTDDHVAGLRAPTCGGGVRGQDLLRKVSPSPGSIRLCDERPLMASPGDVT